MADDKPKRPSAAELAARLRTREKQRRPRRLRILLLLVLLVGVPLGLFVWWSWPPAPPPPLSLVAFDAVGRQDQPIPVMAQLERPEEVPDTVTLGGWPVEFGRDHLPPNSTEAFDPVTVRTTPDGTAAIEVTRTRAPEVLRLRAVFGSSHNNDATNQATLYCWPKDAFLVLVDADRSLIGADPPLLGAGTLGLLGTALGQGSLLAGAALFPGRAAPVQLSTWKSANVRDVPRREDAVAALDAVARGQKYRIVYLACAVDTPSEYFKVRALVQAAPLESGRKRLPGGPVLGRPSYNEEAAANPLLQQVEHLRETFGGRLIGLTSHPATAAVFRQAGLSTFLVGQPLEVPEGVTVLDRWDQVPRRLP